MAIRIGSDKVMLSPPPGYGPSPPPPLHSFEGLPLSPPPHSFPTCIVERLPLHWVRGGQREDDDDERDPQRRDDADGVGPDAQVPGTGLEAVTTPRDPGWRSVGGRRNKCGELWVDICGEVSAGRAARPRTTRYTAAGD